MPAPSLGFGLIGFGAWGRFHADSISKTSGAELKAIAARSEASRNAAQEAFPKARVYADYRDKVKPAAQAGSAEFPVIEPAPGRYVQQRE